MPVLSDNEIFATLKVIRSSGIGAKGFHSLYEVFKSSKKIVKHLKSGSFAQKLISDEQVKIEIERTLEYGADLIAFHDSRYPVLLKQTEGCPPVITVKGRFDDLLFTPKIAIVGSRDASVNGMHFAYEMAISLKNYTICSGLARGIDTYAHNGSLKTGTIAVIAGGIDNIYPPENQNLYQRICSEGVVITEAPFSAIPQAKHFPNRNRIISGLSLGTIVVEATLRSGSLITANFALEQNRELFAVPGFPKDHRYSGTNKLIQNGAYLLSSVDDVINVIEASRHTSIFTQNRKTAPADLRIEEENGQDLDFGDLEKVKNEVMKKLSSSPTDFDKLVQYLAIPRNLLHLAMIELELSQNIKRIGLNNFVILKEKII